MGTAANLPLPIKTYRNSPYPRGPTRTFHGTGVLKCPGPACPGRGTDIPDWRRALPVDPLPALLSATDEAIRYFARRDLGGEDVGPVRRLWALPEPRRLLRRQGPAGSWKYPGRGTRRIRSEEDYDQLETYRSLGILVEKYGMTRDDPGIAEAAEFLFGCQTAEGDIRGIYGNQYTPNYTAGILELLVKAGYAGDPRVRAGFRWLLANRQDDGGWAIPLRTLGGTYARWIRSGRTAEPDRTRPSSHLVTGVVLRAFAGHPRYRGTRDARVAADLLASSLFRRDRYPDRADPSYWTRVSFPFWFTDLVSALDSLSRTGPGRGDPRIRRALAWIAGHQRRDASFGFTLLRARDRDTVHWVSLATCRVLRRFADADPAGRVRSQG